jgi:lysophospholipase L1-like esterase
MRRFIFVMSINILLTVALLLLSDFVITHSTLLYLFVPDSFRIKDPNIRNTLAKNVATGSGEWGGRLYPFRTNSLGFRDQRVREVSIESDTRARVMVIGDSFTEGIGLPWQDTFVGLFQARFPDIEVLNAAAAGYSPSMYWKKTARLLSEHYKIDHLIIYIDISDIQDETLIRFDEAGNIHDNQFLVDPFARVGDPAGTIQIKLPPDAASSGAVGNLFGSNFRVSRYWGRAVFHFLGGVPAPRGTRGLVRSMWTVDGVKLPEGYGDLGVAGGIAKAVHAMDELAEILRAGGISFSVGVYPWPDQIEFDVVASRQVLIWRSWCERNGCVKFIDHFPDFFAAKYSSDWREKFYMDGDVHFNETGNRLIAEKLIATMSDVFATKNK